MFHYCTKTDFTDLCLRFSISYVTFVFLKCNYIDSMHCADSIAAVVRKAAFGSMLGTVSVNSAGPTIIA